MTMRKTTRRVIWTTVAVCIAVVGALRFAPSIGTRDARADEPQSGVVERLAPADTAQQEKLGKEIARTNEQNLGFKGVIRGRVRFRDGRPAKGFTVLARFFFHQTGAPGEGFAVTDANGEYTIRGLNPQQFRVSVEAGGTSYIVPDPRTVALESLPDKTASNIDFTLTLGPKITIRVHDAQTGEPISDVAVFAGLPGGGSSQPRGRTDAKGEFRFRSGYLETYIRLEPGKHDGFTVSEAPGYRLSRNVAFATPDDLRDVEWDVKTYTEDPKRHETTLRGTVTDVEGKPVAGAEVRLVRGTQIETATSDANGAFAIRTYRMQIVEFGDWDGRQRTGLMIEATKDGQRGRHIATPDETWTQIPVRLERTAAHATVSGQVVGVDGKPIANVPIHYNESFVDAQAFVTRNAPNSDAQGRFTVGGLSPDAFYQFRFGKPAQNGNDFGFGVTAVPDAKFTRGFLRLRAGERHDLGRVVVLRSDASVAGRMRTKSGATPQGHFMAVIEGAHTSVNVPVDADGSFRFPHVVREPLRFALFRSTDASGTAFSWGPDRPGEVGWRSIHGGDTAILITVDDASSK